MINLEIITFIKNGLSQGTSREELTRQLLTGGWDQADIAAAFASTDVTVLPEQSSISPRKTKKNALYGLAFMVILIATGSCAYYFLRPRDVLAQALKQSNVLQSISGTIEGTYIIASTSAKISGTFDTDKMHNASQRHIDLTVQQQGITMTVSEDSIAVAGTNYIRLKTSSNNANLNAIYNLGRTTNWIEFTQNDITALKNFDTTHNIEDVTQILAITPLDIIIQSKTEETKEGVTTVEYIAKPSPQFLSKRTQEEKDFFDELLNKNFTIVVQKDSAQIQKIILQSPNYNITLTFKASDSSRTIQVPSKFVPLSKLPMRTGQIPGFSSAASTEQFGGNNTTATVGSTSPQAYYKIRIIPIGIVPPEALSSIQKILTHDFTGATVSIGTTLIPTQDMETPALDGSHTQYNVSRLMDLLQNQAANSDEILVGVTSTDIAAFLTNFVFSASATQNLLYDTPAGGVFSLYRLTDIKNAAVTQSRYEKVLQRVVGLSAGLQPSGSIECATSQVLSVATLDQKGTQWCGTDSAQLRAAGLLK